jgi:hypothetical protein
MTALAEGTRDGGTPWASINAVFPNVKVISKAAIAAVIISHGNKVLTGKKREGGIQYQGVESQEGKGGVSSTRESS